MNKLSLVFISFITFSLFASDLSVKVAYRSPVKKMISNNQNASWLFQTATEETVSTTNSTYLVIEGYSFGKDRMEEIEMKGFGFSKTGITTQINSKLKIINREKYPQGVEVFFGGEIFRDTVKLSPGMSRIVNLSREGLYVIRNSMSGKEVKVLVLANASIFPITSRLEICKIPKLDAGTYVLNFYSATKEIYQETFAVAATGNLTIIYSVVGENVVRTDSYSESLSYVSPDIKRENEVLFLALNYNKK